MSRQRETVVVRGMAWAAAIVLVSAVAARAEDRPRWLGGQIYEENDSILLNGDQRYSQGFRIAVSRNPTTPLCFKKRPVEEGGGCSFPPDALSFDGWLLSRDRKYEQGLAIILGQNIYTPRIITAPVPEPKDRAFSGFLYLGSQISFTSAGERERHSIELDLGLFGQESLAEGAQAGLHTLRHHRIPHGWAFTEPRHWVGVNASYRLEERFPLVSLHRQDPIKRRTLFDATIGYMADAGTVRSAFGLHGTARAGWDLTGFPAHPIMAATRSKRRFFEIGGIVGYEIRSIFNTTFVRATEGTTGFSKEPVVWDFRWGGYVRTGSFRATAQKVNRSAEFSITGVPRHDQDFASVALSYEPLLSADDDEPEDPAARPPHWLWRHWEVELGMGRNFFGPEIATGTPRGHAGHIAIRKWIAKGFNVGLFDIGGVSVEAVPAEPGETSHTDLFLTQNALSLGWKPRGPKGALAFRVGFPLWNRTAKLEIVENPPDENGLLTEEIEERELETAKRGLLLGVQFFQTIEKHLALGVDVTYQRMELPNATALVPSPDFMAVVVAAQIRP